MKITQGGGEILWGAESRKQKAIVADFVQHRIKMITLITLIF